MSAKSTSNSLPRSSRTFGLFVTMTNFISISVSRKFQIFPCHVQDIKKEQKTTQPVPFALFVPLPEFPEICQAPVLGLRFLQAGVGRPCAYSLRHPCGFPWGFSRCFHPKILFCQWHEIGTFSELHCFLSIASIAFCGGNRYSQFHRFYYSRFHNIFQGFFC